MSAKKPATKQGKAATMRKTAAKPARSRAARPKPLRGAALKAHADEILRRLLALYPDAHCELDYRNPYELAVATILSAQCTDKRVNMVTPDLFRRWPDAEALSVAPREEIEQVIQSTGFYRNKAKSLSGFATQVVEHHGGEVPAEMDALVALPGIGRKTANVVLGNAYGINEGIVVDTHVQRLARRFGLTKESDPVKVERALIPLFPRERWTMLSHLMIWHGRRVCDARKPKCGDCALADICPSADLP
ncbi:MAG TPA: endonuclease III [Gemmatimonadaceae bacterium]|nr:endonuclease III [Gemmatimonadaceae bacterium]HRQ77250.1 endonuclease III [Gemmatimonadaceae bacterium]